MILSEQEPAREPQPDRIVSGGADLLSDPIFVLGAPRSFSWLICAMIGQHPQLCALPETQLFCADTLEEWWIRCEQESFYMQHGLFRAIAEYFFGEQTERTIELASGWLRRRAHYTTGMVLEELAQRVHPLVLVEKSPSVVYKVEFMDRALKMFPQARFIHLVRHPIGHGESVLETMRELSRSAPLPPFHWLFHLASYPGIEGGITPAQSSEQPDPQVGWYCLNTNIRTFLGSVQPSRQLLIRGEDLFASPEESLCRIAEWAALRTDDDAIHVMQHPERCPFACLGPDHARYGTDLFLAESPYLHAEKIGPYSLSAPVPWGNGKLTLAPEVQRLAAEFGYS